DRDQLQPDGRCQSRPPAGGELALVRDLSVCVRGSRRRRGPSLGDGSHSPCGTWSGPGGRLCSRRGGRAVVRKLPKGGWRLFPLLVALAAGCDLPGEPNPAERPNSADQVKDFGTLYATHCAGCHGADGKLGPAPPLNDPIFLAIVPDGELLRVI